MTKTFDQLIDHAYTNLDEENKSEIEPNVFSNISMAYSLIAIAQELHRMNEHRAFEVEQRLDLSEAQIDRLAALAE